MDAEFIGDVLDTLDRATALRDKAPPSEKAPGLHAQLSAAVTFLSAGAAACRSLYPKLFDEAVKAREPAEPAGA